MLFLCQASELPEGTSKGFECGERSLFAVRKFGRCHVYENRCPHIGVPLEWLPDQFLDAEGELIQCSTHGALFVIDTGVCVAGPCIGDALVAVPCEERDGALYLLGD